MKTLIPGERKTASAMRKGSPYAPHPLGPEQLAQQAGIKNVLRSIGVQPKLTIGKPNDKYEQEADRVADQVMAMPDPGLQRRTEHEEEEETLQSKPLANHVTPFVQRQEVSAEEVEGLVQAKLGNRDMNQSMCQACEEETTRRQPEDDRAEELRTKSETSDTSAATSNLESSINSLKGGGQPLPRITRRFFESRMGQDFSRVRVHTDNNAASVAQSIQAKAFTRERDVVFGPGQYQPQSSEGKRLLGHELTHVVQQRSSDNWMIQRQDSPDSQKTKSSTSTGLVPLDAKISPASMFYVRESADGDIFGKLAVKEMNVKVLGEKGKLLPKLWYKLRFKVSDFKIILKKYADEVKKKFRNPKQSLEARIARQQKAAPPSAGGLGRSGRQMNAYALAYLYRRLKVYEDAINAYEDTLKKVIPNIGWVGQAALSIVVMPWDPFIKLIEAFEKKYASDPLRDRLTRLRQIGEDSGLEGDAIVGTGSQIKGKTNIDKRAVDTTKWQLLLEAKAVRTPGGEVVDIHHFILGLDALALPAAKQSKNRKLSKYLGIASVTIGESIAATTWSGDIGGAVGDYVMHKSVEWEKKNTSGDNTQRLNFYYQTRAPESDLLGDLDAWAAYGLVPQGKKNTNNISSIKDILVSYYGNTASSGQKKPPVGRGQGVINFLKHYGFKSVKGLTGQQTAVQNVVKQTYLFSKGWYEARSGTGASVFGTTTATTTKLYITSFKMTEKFLKWMEALAAANGVSDVDLK